MLRLLQINLHHSKAASAALLIRLARGEDDIVLIQEPWVAKNKVCGLKTKTHTLLYASKCNGVRSCILVRNNLNSFLISSYSDRDITAVSLELGSSKIWLIAAYLAHDSTEPLPQGNLGSLITTAEASNIGVIIGSDANAHHTIWGSSDTNERGELLFDFILSSNLSICNVGVKPTFIIKNRQEVLDVTLVSNFLKYAIRNWKVSEEHSFSDHRYIEFNLDIVCPIRLTYRNRKRTNWHSYKSSFKDLLPEEPPVQPDTSQSLDSLVEEFSGFFNRSTEISCPMDAPRGKQRPPWWSGEIRDLRRACRKLFNRAKHTRNETDWNSYKENLKIYKKELRKAQRTSWKSFCGNIEDTSEASRLRKLLAKTHSSPSYLVKPDGSWTNSSEESLETLVNTHFPGNTIIEGQDDNNVNLFTHNFSDSCIDNIISKEKIIWAIKTFQPYKSAGTDEIIPAELQLTLPFTIEWLEVIFRACLKLVHIPRKWTKVKVVFIPKAGKSDHTCPKNLRPISLSSFLLKTLERLIEVYLRSTIDKRLLSDSQHAYCKGKSTETALHSIVYSIEKSLDCKEYTLAAFLDIEGAFNNIKPKAIADALTSLEIEDLIRGWITRMLSSRIIVSSLGGSSIERLVSRGTPQGGVLSPLLWNIVINNLLLELEGKGFKVIAYADDVAILVTGKFPITLKERMQVALDIMEKWANECGLGINPQKTELVLFTRRYRIPIFDPPILRGTRLVFNEQAKFLGVILDRKLSWKPNIAERVKKATIALYSCKTAIGKTWGINPRIMYWLFTSVIRPILLYGVTVWWPALNTATNLRALEKVQRSAALCITGALRTTPSYALNTILSLTPLELLSKQMAASAAIRLKAISMWKNLSVGHSSILQYFRSIPDITDYISPTFSFRNAFKTTIPSREDWKEGRTLNNNSVHFYTDGSKLDGKVGSGVFSDQLNINIAFRLPDYCSVFQAEVVAINEVIDWLRYNTISTTDIVIFTDSQAAIKSLGSVSCRSIVVQECQSSLNEMAEHFNVQLTWVPGHTDVPGNCTADELARKGTTLQILPKREQLGIPLSTCKLMLQEETYRQTNVQWKNRTTCRTSRLIWPKLDLRRSKQLINLQRRDISLVVGVLTGHCLIGNHASRLGFLSNDFCRSCNNEEEEENITHFLCSCPALMNRRNTHLGCYFFEGLSDLAKIDIGDLQRFIKSSKWFEETSI